MTPGPPVPGFGAAARCAPRLPARFRRSICARSARRCSTRFRSPIRCCGAGAARRILIVGAEAHAAAHAVARLGRARGHERSAPVCRRLGARHAPPRLGHHLRRRRRRARGRAQPRTRQRACSPSIFRPTAATRRSCASPRAFASARTLPARRSSDESSVASTWTAAKSSNTPITKLPRSGRGACARRCGRADRRRRLVRRAPGESAHQRSRVPAPARVPIEKMPSNIDRLGNTSGATIPILMDEMRRDGRLKPGQLICVLALGAGFHWGSLLLRT